MAPGLTSPQQHIHHTCWEEAFLLAGEMAVAYFYVHVHKGFWPVENGGELAALCCFVYLFLAAAGPGAWSLDSRIARGRGSD